MKRELYEVMSSGDGLTECVRVSDGSSWDVPTEHLPPGMVPGDRFWLEVRIVKEGEQ